MRKSRIKDVVANKQRKRLSVSDTPNTGSAAGISKAADEMRRIQVFANELADEQEALRQAQKPQPPTQAPTVNSNSTNTSTTNNADGTYRAVIKLENQTIVPRATSWNFLNSGNVKFSITQSPTGQGNISANADFCVYGTNVGISPTSIPRTIYKRTKILANGCRVLEFRSIRAGGDIHLSPDASGDLLSFYSNIYGTNLAASIDTSIYVNKTADTQQGYSLNFRPIKAGSGISISLGTQDEVNDHLVIDCIAITALANIGAGSQIYKNSITIGSTTTHNLRTLVQGNNITLTQGTDTITISSANSTYAFENVGGAKELYKETVPGITTTWLSRFKTIEAGTNVNIDDSDPNKLIIHCTASSGGGVYSGSNLGTSGSGKAEVFSTINPSNVFLFRRLHQGSNITIGQDADYIYISSLNNTYSANSLGTGSAIYAGSTTAGYNTTFHFNSILEGDNITFTAPDANTIRINANVPTYIGANLGAGAQIYKSTTGTTLLSHNLRTLVEGTNISIVQGTDTITINCTLTDTDTTYSVNNVGTGTGLVYSSTTAGTPNIFNLRKIKEGAHITVTTESNDIIIASDLKSYLGANLGPGAQIYKNTSTTGVPLYHNLRTLIEGDNITIVQGTDTITISSSFCVHGENIGTPDDDETLYEIYKQTVTDGLCKVLQFKRISVFDDISISETTDVLHFRVNVLGNNLNEDAWDFAGIPRFPLYTEKTYGTGHTAVLNFKSLYKGAGIAIEESAGGIKISCVASTALANIGAGAQIYKNSTTAGDTTTHNLRTLVQGANVTLTQGSDTVTIAATNSTYTGANLGSGAQLYHSTTVVSGDNYAHNFRSLQQADEAAITQEATRVKVSTKLHGSRYHDYRFYNGTSLQDSRTIPPDIDQPISFITPTYTHADISQNSTNKYEFTVAQNGIYNINAAVAGYTRDPTNNAAPAVAKHIELCLFINSVFYSYLFVDKHSESFAGILEYLAINFPSYPLPDQYNNANDFWLSGSDSVHLAANDTISIRLRHRSGGNILFQNISEHSDYQYARLSINSESHKTATPTAPVDNVIRIY